LARPGRHVSVSRVLRRTIDRIVLSPPQAGGLKELEFATNDDWSPDR
jgi:hypothetical protein